MIEVMMLVAMLGQAPDVSSMYEVTTQGSTPKLKVGEQGKFVLEIVSKTGAHISDEAPLKVDLKATGVKVEKEKLTNKDSTGSKRDGAEYPNPHFEVPITASVAGKAVVEAKLKFFVCTDKSCTPQTKTVSVPVDVI